MINPPVLDIFWDLIKSIAETAEVEYKVNEKHKQTNK